MRHGCGKAARVLLVHVGKHGPKGARRDSSPGAGQGLYLRTLCERFDSGPRAPLAACHDRSAGVALVRQLVVLPLFHATLPANAHLNIALSDDELIVVRGTKARSAASIILR